MSSLKFLENILDKLFFDSRSWIPTIVAFIILLFVLFVLRCGGGEGDDPVYNDNGICVANCPDNNGTDNGTDKDGFVADDNIGKENLLPVDGSVDGMDNGVDGNDGSTDKAEVEPYVCPSEIPPPEQQEACMPKEAKNSYCSWDNYGTQKICWEGFYTDQPCTTDSFCQQVPLDQWPPCVCWQFCGYAGEWECGESGGDIKLTDNKDGTCLIGQLYFGKPNDPPPRYPLTDDPECYMELNETGDQIETFCKGMSSYTCNKQE